MCSDHLLLVLSSIGADKSLLEAAIHHPRARAAARRVVGASQASQFPSSDLLRVVLAVVLGGFERVEALRDAHAGQDGCLSMCSAWV